MAITTATITEATSTNQRHHAHLDKNDGNMHHAKGYRNATIGSNMWKSEENEQKWEQFGFLPACLDIQDSTATPDNEDAGGIYVLDNSSEIYVITSIAWQSANTVRITYSGSPDLSGISTANNNVYIYGSGITNTEHIGRFALTTVNDGSDYIEITNPSVTDATLDESSMTNSSAEHPHVDWDGASNGDWVRYDGTSWYRVEPIAGMTCYDAKLLMNRTFNGTKWLGQEETLAIAFGDESTAHTTGTAKVSFHMPYEVILKEVKVSLVTAATGTDLFTVDLNDDGTSVFSTVVTLDASEKISSSAATPAVISSTSIAEDSLMTVDIDTIGNTVAGAGGKIYLIYNRT